MIQTDPSQFLAMMLMKERIYRDFMKLRDDERLYREVELSDGAGRITKVFSKLAGDGSVLVIQVGQREEVQGPAIVTGDPLRFETTDEFQVWLFELLKKSFERLPFVTICPIRLDEIKAKEREHTSAMYW